VTFLSTRPPFDVTYRDYQFRALRPARSLVANEAWKASIAQLRRGNQLITATSRERTFADCLDNLKWGGGIEEVLRSVGGFPSLNVENLIAYLDLLRSASATAKVGWALSTDPDLWNVTPAELEALRSRLGKGPYFLAQRREEKTLAREWRLYVPVGLDAREALRG
jgi:predicted transcriptional regulator of viral defense system